MPEAGPIASDPLSRLIGRLWGHVGATRRRQFGLLLGLMVIASIAEAVSIGAVLPFLSALTQPSLLFDRPAVHSMANSVGIMRAEDLVLPLTIAFAAATMLSAAIRILLLWGSTRFAFAFGSDLSNKVYRHVLHQSYRHHIERNSSKVVDAIWTKVSEVIFFVLLPMMVMFSSIIIVVAVCTLLFFAVPKIALLAFGCLGFAYALFIKTMKKRLAVNSQRIASQSANLVKSLNEGLGGIRDILVDNSQKTFSDAYRSINQQLRAAQGDNQIIGQSPRFVVEALGMLLIAALAYGLSRDSTNMAATVPTLAALALGMQRLLPAAQQLYNSWSYMHGSTDSLREVLSLLAEPSSVDAMASEVAPVPFTDRIELRDVSFRYSDESPWILKHIDLVIPRGGRLGFVGPTGCGKSTLLDMVMGLLDPTSGGIYIDGQRFSTADARSWQKHVAHVPQAVFLSDASIAENIAFGTPISQIDAARVREVARRAQLASMIEAWPQQYDTRVGERGVQLSGGQRQRIGIARALYKNADVIILDEATSALDTDTEKAVMSAIESLGRDITILIIAHRIHTLDGCDEIVQLGQGSIVARHANTASIA